MWKQLKKRKILSIAMLVCILAGARGIVTLGRTILLYTPQKQMGSEESIYYNVISTTNEADRSFYNPNKQVDGPISVDFLLEGTEQGILNVYRGNREVEGVIGGSTGTVVQDKIKAIDVFYLYPGPNMSQHMYEIEDVYDLSTYEFSQRNGIVLSQYLAQRLQVTEGDELDLPNLAATVVIEKIVEPKKIDDFIEKDVYREQFIEAPFIYISQKLIEDQYEKKAAKIQEQLTELRETIDIETMGKEEVEALLAERYPQNIMLQPEKNYKYVYIYVTVIFENNDAAEKYFNTIKALRKDEKVMYDTEEKVLSEKSQR